MPELSVKTPLDLLDGKRYPLTDLNSKTGSALVQMCRQQLSQSGVCVLDGFLNPAATAALARESQRLASLNFHSTVWGNAYLEPMDPELPDDHPRRQQEITELGVVAYDQVPPGSLLRDLYEWETMLHFLAKALGKEKVYRYADPLGALNISVMDDGDYLRWHFDQTDFVVSLALQDAAEGGDFEYVPNIRSRTEENYGAIKALLAGDRSRVKRLEMNPGSLVLFEGRHSIHRVTPIRGKVTRLVALLGYDTAPGVVSTDHLRKMRYGRTG
jgi:hypothetical protein